MPLRVGCRADDSDKHDLDVNFLLFHKGKLYTAADDGKIKVWTPDLKKLAEVQSNPCSVFCLAASDHTLYSCSNEGTIKSFELNTLKEKREIVRDPKCEVSRIAYADGCLYSGDTEGYIKVWKGDTFYGSMNIAEPIKDMQLWKNLIFTVRDSDVVVTDFHLGSEKLQYGTKTSFMGRSPIALIGDSLFAFSSRQGMDIVLHENNDNSHFKAVTQVKGAHEKVINALAGASWGGKKILFSGGWDKQLKKWNIDDDLVKLDSSCDVDIVINAITLGERGEIYIGGSDGHIVRVEVE